MLLDALGIAALAHELRSAVGGGRVQEVVQPHRLAVTLEVYAGCRVYLTLSADPRDEGVALGTERPRRGEGAPTPLLLALRARAVGARLRGTDQPPLERVLLFSFEGSEPFRLVAELMGRMANLILVDQAGVVVASARRVTPEMTRARVVLPGRPYEPPPAPAKTAPGAVTPEQLTAWLAEAPGSDLWRVLVRSVRGLSPMAAREVVARAKAAAEGGAAHGPGPTALAASLRELFSPVADGTWQPAVVRSGGRVVAYTPYLPLRLPVDVPEDSLVEAAPSMAAAMAAYERDRGSGDPYRHARDGVARELAAARERVERRAAALAREHWDEEQIEALREAGDLILTYQSMLRRGDRVLQAPDAARGGLRLIDVDPALSAVENAQAYYRRYRSRRRAAEAYHERLAAIDAERAALDQWALDLELAEDRPGIDGVLDALVEAGHVKVTRGRHRPAQASRPLALYSSDGMRVLVGRNSRQNAQVTFRQAARGDLWLHARGVPGGHVVIKCGGRPVPEATLREAASLAAYYSRARNEARADVVVTDIRHVRHLRGGDPGLVTYERERTLDAVPRGPHDLGLV